MNKSTKSQYKKLAISFGLILIILFILVQLIFMWTEKYTKHGVEIEIPDIKTMSLDQAVENLESHGLEYEIDTSKYDPKIKPNQILSIYPESGSKVKPNSFVYIRANAKTWKAVILPDIINKSKYLAFEQLKVVGLNVTDTLYEPNIAKDMVLKVLYKNSSIAPGYSLSRNSNISLVIGQGLNTNTLVPDIRGLSLAEAKKVLGKNLYNIGAVHPESGNSNDIVYYQIPEANSVYDQGLYIDVYVSNKNIADLDQEIKSLDSIYGYGANQNKYPSSTSFSPSNPSSNSGSSSSSSKSSSSPSSQEPNLPEEAQEIMLNNDPNEETNKPVEESSEKKELNRVIID